MHKEVWLVIVLITVLCAGFATAFTSITACNQAMNSNTKYQVTAPLTQNGQSCLNLNGLQNVDIDCTGNTLTGLRDDQNDAVNVTSSGNITIRNCHVSSWRDGVDVYNSNDVVVRDSTFDLSNRTNVFDGDVRLSLINITVTNTGSSYWQGVFVQDTAGGMLVNSTISASANADVDLENVSSFTVANDVFKDAIIGSGLVVGNYGRDVLITNNSVYNNFLQGIQVADSENVTIKGNTVDGYGGNVGIWVIDSQNSTVRDNTVLNNDINAGIMVSGLAPSYFDDRYNMVVNNTLIGCAWGLDSESAAYDVWENNTVTNTENNPIYMTDDHDLVFQHNVFNTYDIGNTGGVWHDNVSDSTFKYMTFTNGPNSTWEVNNSQDNVWDHITINTAAIGIVLTNSSGNRLNDITFTGVPQQLRLVSSLDTYVSNTTLSNLMIGSRYADIRFTEPITTGPSALSFGDATLGRLGVSVKSALEPRLNKSANIIMRNVNLVSPTIMYDPTDSGTYVPCPSSICTQLSYDGSDVFVFAVTHFSGYELQGQELAGVPEFGTWALIVALAAVTVGIVYMRRRV